jgi:hypothetical protein
VVEVARVVLLLLLLPSLMVVVVGDDVAKCWQQVTRPTATAGFGT